MAVLDIVKEVQDALARESGGDPAAHMQVLDSLQRLQNAVWTPMEKMTRLRVQLYHNVCVRLAQEHGIFEELSAKGRATARELSIATNVDQLLILRIMRILTAIGFADEVGSQTYHANETTKVCIRKGYIADVKYTTEVAMKVCSNVAQTVNEGIDTHTFTMGKPHFTWLSEDPDHGPGFNEFMTERRNAVWEKWYRIYPMASKIRENQVDKDVFLVDIGGGLGLWTQELLRELEGRAPGRLIVQDQPQVVQGIDIEGIETVSYDFFTPQPVKGAQYYFFKQVIHNWSDSEALKILKNTAEAMDDSSTCLINDHVLPEEKVSLRISYWDLSMLVLMSGIERTQSQWAQLLKEAGLQIVQIWYEEKITGEVTEAVIECKKIGWDRQ